MPPPADEAQPARPARDIGVVLGDDTASEHQLAAVGGIDGLAGREAVEDGSHVSRPASRTAGARKVLASRVVDPADVALLVHPVPRIAGAVHIARSSPYAAGVTSDRLDDGHAAL
jgi:metal-dependent amidase/aminoacylase/carboxypeptidase family protein